MRCPHSEQHYKLIIIAQINSLDGIYNYEWQCIGLGLWCMEVDFPGGRRTSSFQQHIQNPIAARRQLVVGHSGLSNTVHTGYSARGGTTKKLALYPIFLLIRTPSHMMAFPLSVNVYQTAEGPSGRVEYQIAEFVWGGFHIWRPQWVGGTQKADNRNKICWFATVTGGKKIRKFCGHHIWKPPEPLWGKIPLQGQMSNIRDRDWGLSLPESGACTVGRPLSRDIL